MWHSVITERQPRARALAAAALLVLAPGWATAGTYYVDPQSGSDGNPGTSASAPWRTPPGTRTANNGAYVAASWGSVGSSAKVPCGSTIFLKGGSTQTAAQGGGWRLDSDYYAGTCGASNPIVIQVATESEWPGSSGHFTLDGNGITPTFHPSYGYSSHPGLVSVANVNYVWLRGRSAAQRVVLKNSGAMGIVINRGGGSQAGFRGDWWELSSSDSGVNIGDTTDWQISNVVAHDMGYSAFQTGLNVDHIVERGAFVNAEAYRSGSPTALTGADDAFFFVGGKDLWCVRCTAHDNPQRGFNTGYIWDPTPTNFELKFRDLVAYNNGASCVPGHWCYGGGFGISGNDAASSYMAQNTIVGATLFHNYGGGLWSYGDGAIEIWSSTAHNTGYGGEWATTSYRWDVTARQLSVLNSVNAKASAGDDLWSSNNASVGQSRRLVPIVLGNCFRHYSSPSEQLGLSDFAMGSYGTPPPWIGSTNDTGDACDPRFTAVHDSDWSLANFTPAAGSSLIDAGRFLMLASGAGSNATTIAVKANGGSSDPRRFFIGASSYLDPSPADRRIQIEGCGVRTVESMTASTITFSPACSWADGAGVHLPWSGARPDIGAYESGALPPPPPPLGPPGQPILVP